MVRSILDVARNALPFSLCCILCLFLFEFVIVVNFLRKILIVLCLNHGKPKSVLCFVVRLLGSGKNVAEERLLYVALFPPTGLTL